jgi:hypothetical protein
MATLNLCPTALDMCVSRGDSEIFAFTLVDSAGVVIDISGFTFIMTGDTREEPSDTTTHIFQLTGVVPLGTDGRIVFTPAITDFVDLGDNFFDVQQNDSGIIRTIIKGGFDIQQDITKA